MTRPTEKKVTKTFFSAMTNKHCVFATVTTYVEMLRKCNIASFQDIKLDIYGVMAAGCFYRYEHN